MTYSKVPHVFSVWFLQGNAIARRQRNWWRRLWGSQLKILCFFFFPEKIMVQFFFLVPFSWTQRSFKSTEESKFKPNIIQRIRRFACLDPICIYEAGWKFAKQVGRQSERILSGNLSVSKLQCGMQGRCQQKQHELESENGQLKQARLLVGNEFFWLLNRW